VFVLVLNLAAIRDFSVDGRSGEAQKLGQRSVAGTAWWEWLVIAFFPMVLHPRWAAIISVAAFVLFLRLVLGPFPARRKSN
jgi:hypothetical protein